MWESCEYQMKIIWEYILESYINHIRIYENIMREICMRIMYTYDNWVQLSHCMRITYILRLIFEMDMRIIWDYVKENHKLNRNTNSFD